MTTPQAIDIVRDALYLMLQISLPVLAAAVVIGLVVSIAQAVTQVQEQTLSFVPKIVGMTVVAASIAPWATQLMLEFARRMFSGEYLGG